MKSRYLKSLRDLFRILLAIAYISGSEVQASSIDYAPYRRVLENYVVESAQSTRVKYESLKKNSADLYKFNQAVSSIPMQEFKKWSERDQIAFLINAYNSFTLQLIIENYPVTSIKKIGGLFGNPWKKKFFRFFGEDSNLDRIEHEILRKNYKEPRIHFAVNCASVGCPPLQRSVFEGEKLEEQLTSAAKHFVVSSDFNRFDPNLKSLKLSSIFKWYGSDFGDEKQLRVFIADHMGATGELRESILKTTKIEFIEYDWSLNDAK